MEDKSTNFSRRQQGKRKLAELNSCKVLLKNELSLLIPSFYDAVEKADEVMRLFPPQSRGRALEAVVMQSLFAESVMRNFGNYAFYGKNKRLILRAKEHIILFKKLNNKGLPMNAKTINVQSIFNQQQSLDLFSESKDWNDEPILYFGYQKDRFGDYLNPQLIYIDDEKISFSIQEKDIETVQSNTISGKSDFTNNVKVSPKLKNHVVEKKVN